MESVAFHAFLRFHETLLGRVVARTRWDGVEFGGVSNADRVRRGVAICVEEIEDTSTWLFVKPFVKKTFGTQRRAETVCSAWTIYRHSAVTPYRMWDGQAFVEKLVYEFRRLTCRPLPEVAKCRRRFRAVACRYVPVCAAALRRQLSGRGQGSPREIERRRRFLTQECTAGNKWCDGWVAELFAGSEAQWNPGFEGTTFGAGPGKRRACLPRVVCINFLSRLFPHIVAAVRKQRRRSVVSYRAVIRSPAVKKAATARPARPAPRLHLLNILPWLTTLF